MAFEPPRMALEGGAGEGQPSLGEMLRHPARWWPDALLDRPFVPLETRRRPVVLLADPQAVSTILLNHGNRFPRSRMQDRILGEGYGSNLIQGDRLDWRRQRRAIAQPINADRASRMVPRLSLACADLIADWHAAGAEATVDLLSDTPLLTLDGLYRALFASESAARRRDPQVERVAREIAGHGPVELTVELAALRLLAERIQGDRASDEIDTQSGPIEDLNTLTLFLHAGHDNASAALAWALWLLAHREDLQDAIAREWRAARGQAFSLANHPTAQAVVRETLRLYPPIIQLMREIGVDLPVAGERIAKGTTAVLAIYALHRHRTRWDEPDAFAPERFLTGQVEEAARAVWLPFGTGPRGCIGSGLARVELALYLSMLCDRFVLAPNADDPLRCHVEWTLRPVGKRPLRIRPRA